MGFEVFIVVMIQVDIFRVLMPCNVAVRDQCFGGPCCLHLQYEFHGTRKWTQMKEKGVGGTEIHVIP
jgi:hypothetical protein